MVFDFTPFLGKPNLFDVIKKNFQSKYLYWQPLRPNQSKSSQI